MKYPKYDYTTEDDFCFFEFVSVGNKGNIIKIVQYEKISENFYNLGFGDYNPQTEQVDDEIVTNNGDGIKVLSTVVATLYVFTQKYPEVNVFATGSSQARTRLYRMGITNNLVELKKDFFVYGFRKDGVFEEFVVGEDYEGFLVKRKQSK